MPSQPSVVLSSDFAEKLVRVLPLILGQKGALPEDWDPHATTYDLPRFDSEQKFAARLDAALTRIEAEGVREAAALQDILASCGLPYDYARLGQPLSTMLELLIQARTGAARVFSFASVTKPWLSIIEAPGRTLPVRVFAEGSLPGSAALKARLRARGVELHEQHREAIVPNAETLTVAVYPGATAQPLRDGAVDAACFPVENGGILLIRDEARISPKAIQVVRKRTLSALLATDALRELERAANLTPTVPPESTAARCDARLRALFPEITEALYFCTGLAAEAAVFTAAAEVLGPARTHFFYAQNGYGGTGQLITDLLARETSIEPVPLPVLSVDALGKKATLIDRIVERLEVLAGAPACVFLETPTNPELQTHDFEKLMSALQAYAKRWGTQIPVLVDTTFAPLFSIFPRSFAQNWPFLLVKSGSKYLTKGKSTLGLVACAADPQARAILAKARALQADADSFAKPSQLADLEVGLGDLRPRMATITQHTVALAQGLRQSLGARGHDITLYAMTEAQAREGLDCGLLSFYLPPAPTPYADLVDEFVADLLVAAPELVKSRVSYGQSRGGGRLDWFYVINPQESTQGSLPEAVKKAQKKDNVQICRISVPEHADVPGLLAAMQPFFDRKYGPVTTGRRT